MALRTRPAGGGPAPPPPQAPPQAPQVAAPQPKPTPTLLEAKPGLRTTPGFHATVHGALVGLLIALLLGNVLLLYAGVLLFMLLLTEAVTAFPTVGLAAELAPRDVTRGGSVVLRVRGNVGGGVGTLRIAVPLPDEAEVVRGATLRVVTVRPWTQTLDWEVEVRPLRRGAYRVGEVKAEFVSVFGGLAHGYALGQDQDLLVRPRQEAVPRLREVRTYGQLPFPEEALAERGIRSTEFRDLRLYSPGDPVRWINWRATAKQVSRGFDVPMVNEYEIEGRRAVLVLLDASPAMAVGSNVDNAFERLVEAAVGLVSYFLARGYKVGVQVWPHLRFVAPDTGPQQVRRVMLELVQVHAHAAPRAGPRGLLEAVEASRRYLVTDRPTCFVFTRPEAHGEKLGVALRRIRALVGRRASLFVLAVDWSGLQGFTGDEAPFLVGLTRAKLRTRFAEAKRLGAPVVAWDPERQNFGAVLAGISARAGVRR